MCNLLKIKSFRMKLILLVILLAIGASNLNAQCPQTSQITSSGKCIRITYTIPPSPLPAFLVYNGVQFNFLSGLGTVGSPAEYKDPAATGACSSYSGANANITLPSGTVCTYVGGVLPVSFIEISGNVDAINRSTISWKVQEAFVDRYYIEKSKDRINFHTIATVASKGDGVNTYTYEELLVQRETSYYRIKQVDKDGRTGYSIIIKISSSLKKDLVTIYPNPASSKLVVTSGTDLINTTAVLSDISGRDIMQLSIRAQVSVIDINEMPQGIYVLRFANGSTHKFLKQ